MATKKPTATTAASEAKTAKTDPDATQIQTPTNDAALPENAAPRPKFKVKKHVTLEHLKFENGVEYFLKFIGAMKKADDMPSRSKAAPDSKAAKMEPPILAPVINLETGEEQQIICPEVLKANLEKSYPDDSYIDVCFSITKYAIQGKQYSGFKILEIELTK